MHYKIKDTLEDNLWLCTLDEANNLVNGNIVILKRVSAKEHIEHLGYFHQLSRDLKLPYNSLLETVKKHHEKLIKKNKDAK